MKRKSNSSALPEDIYTQTDASNFGLDGFAELDYGSGLEHDPYLSGPASGTPNFASADTYGDDSLAVMLKEGSDLADLSWLEMSDQELQAEAMRAQGIKNPAADGDTIAQLQQQWESNKPVQGIHFAANQEHREAVKAPKERRTAAELEHEVHAAMRKSAKGYPLHDILHDVANRLGHDAYRIKEQMERVAKDHGLAGRVFIRAEAYPDCDQGKWAKDVAKTAKTAAYVVAKKDCAGCKFAQEGSCQVFKKALVEKVDWEEARNHYAKTLKVSGQTVSMEGKPRAAIRTAFEQGPKISMPKTSYEYTYVPSDHISLETAWKKFAQSAPAVAPVISKAPVLSSKDKVQKRAHNKVRAQVARWVKNGSLTEAQAKIVLAAKDPQWMIKQVAKELSKTTPVVTEYAGTKYASRQDAAFNSRVSELQVAKVARWVRQKMNEGVVGSELDGLIQARFASNVLDASAQVVSDIRDTHEGLSGHLYVDASAYASAEGDTGCEQGALKHRANPIKMVLAMDRCASCVLAVKREDGSTVCQKYSKELVTSAELPKDATTAYKEAALMAAEASDVDVTAGMFNPNEFGLENPLDGFDLNDSRAPMKILAETDFTFEGVLITSR